MSKARIELHGLTAEMVLNGPPLNLFDATMMGAVETALEEVRGLVAAGEARALLVRAEGNVFCAGVDVHEFQSLTPAEGAALMARYLAAVHALEALPIPTVAVVHALNLTIGWELTLGCDLMWAADDASFGLVEATVGLTPGGGGTQRLVGRVGVARAAEIVMTGDVFPAADLHSWGAINTLLPKDRLLEEARAYTARLAAGPTFATGVGKRIIRTARDHGIAAADAITPQATGEIFATADLPAGITSLLEHGPRKATFEGR